MNIGFLNTKDEKKKEKKKVFIINVSNDDDDDIGLGNDYSDRESYVTDREVDAMDKIHAWVASVEENAFANV